MTDKENIAYLLNMVHDLHNRLLKIEGNPAAKPGRWSFLWRFITG